jgi:glucokinase
MNYLIGIDIGGSSAKSVLVTSEGRALSNETVPFNADILEDWSNEIRQFVRKVENEHGPATGIGVSAPGLASEDNCSIAHMPGRLDGLEGLNWTKFFAKEYTVPVLNDAHAALLGEVWMGAAKGLKNVILLTLGTGVGGAILNEGELLQGTIGRAGHLGHVSLDPDGPPDICNTPGSLELAMGTCTVQERSRGRFKNMHELVDAYEAGDQDAADIWLKSVKALAAAIASFINILDPQAVIVGGGVSKSGTSLFQPLNQYLDQMEWRPGGRKVKILPPELGKYAGAYGAACFAKQRRQKSPSLANH